MAISEHFAGVLIILILPQIDADIPTQAQRNEIERTHVTVRENVSPPAKNMRLMVSPYGSLFLLNTLISAIQ